MEGYMGCELGVFGGGAAPSIGRLPLQNIRWRLAWQLCAFTPGYLVPSPPVV